jgi:hypothetical protein
MRQVSPARREATARPAAVRTHGGAGGRAGRDAESSWPGRRLFVGLCLAGPDENSLAVRLNGSCSTSSTENSLAVRPPADLGSASPDLHLISVFTGSSPDLHWIFTGSSPDLGSTSPDCTDPVRPAEGQREGGGERRGRGCFCDGGLKNPSQSLSFAARRSPLRSNSMNTELAMLDCLQFSVFFCIEFVSQR